THGLRTVGLCFTMQALSPRRPGRTPMHAHAPWGLTLALLLGGPAACADPPAAKDAHGDPLPAGAVARFGTARWRPGDACLLLAFSPDGKTLLAVDRTSGVSLWDVADGKPLRRVGAVTREARGAALAPG